MKRHVRVVAIAVLVPVLLSGCANRSYTRGEDAARAGDWDSAVVYYRQALQDDPRRHEYRIALERAMLEAAAVHRNRAQVFDRQGDIAAALPLYRRVLEYDPGDRTTMLRAAEIERTLRDQAEAERPRPRIEAMREEARRKTEPPLLSPTQDIIDLRITEEARVRDVLSTLGSMTGINITYERDAQKFLEQPITIDLVGVTVEEALDLVLTQNLLWYKVMSPRTIMVIQESPQKRLMYENQVIRTFYLSHATVEDMVGVIKQMIGAQVVPPPQLVGNKTQNSLTVRASDRIVSVIEQIVERNDRPAAEIMADVEILEVSRTRLKDLGVDLSQHSVGAIFSPERAPGTGEDGADSSIFNLNTITRGVSPADFYLTVPQAIINFLETDSHTRTLAKSQVRGMEGQQLVLNHGDRVPIPTTQFAGLGTGGAQFLPMTSFTYEPVGVNILLTPRVTYNDEILMELELEQSSLGAPVTLGDQSFPIISQRRAHTFLRLREGESHLLAGLIRQETTRQLTGVPGLIRIPGLRRLFGHSQDNDFDTDVVMLITPRIVRTHEITQSDLDPIHVGSQINLGLTGPPPVIGEPDAPEAGVPEPGAPAIPPDPELEGEEIPGEPEDGEAEATQPGTARVAITAPGVELTADGGPYTMPISIVGASRVSTMSLTIAFDPNVLRVRTVQAGTFMNQGGIQSAFTERVDAAAGRVDITIARPGDQLGASGTGLLAAVLFDAVAPGSSEIAPSGAATAPDGSAVSLQLTPTAVVVK